MVVILTPIVLMVVGIPGQACASLVGSLPISMTEIRGEQRKPLSLPEIKGHSCGRNNGSTAIRFYVPLNLSFKVGMVAVFFPVFFLQPLMFKIA